MDTVTYHILRLAIKGKRKDRPIGEAVLQYVRKHIVSDMLEIVNQKSRRNYRWESQDSH